MRPTECSDLWLYNLTENKSSKGLVLSCFKFMDVSIICAKFILQISMKLQVVKLKGAINWAGPSAIQTAVYYAAIYLKSVALF